MSEAPTAEAGATPAAPAEAPAPGALRPEDGTRAPLSWPARALALAGWGVVLIGALGAYDTITHFAFAIPWRDLAEWFVYAALFHDLIVAPVVTLVALGVSRYVPSLIKAPVAVGLIVSASLVVMSYPRLRGYGVLPDNPSILPGNAARDLITGVALVWLVVAVVVVVRLVRARTSPRPQ